MSSIFIFSVIFVAIMVIVVVLMFSIGTVYRVIKFEKGYIVQKEMMNGWANCYMTNGATRLFTTLDEANDAMMTLMDLKTEDMVVSTARKNIFGTYFNTKKGT